MREIKFRAWDKRENKMNNNGCIGAGSSCQLIIIEFSGRLSACNAYGLHDGTNPSNDPPVTDRFNLMQYTGLKDKNGKEIYEGDIMHDTSINARCSVVFGCFETLLDDFGIGETSPKFCVEWSDKSGHGEIDVRNEVIGNIYENPKLLCSIK